MRILQDARIFARDTTPLAADIFLPDNVDRSPALISLSPYQKDIPWFVPTGHTAARHEHQAWETPDPLQWCKEGYAVVRVDARGSGLSGGVHSVFSVQEATDFYDSVEWVAQQPWCTGNVGATGISYYAMSQWRVAALAPPSLRAIVPWSGSADVYREFVYRGGMMIHDFFVQWYSRLVADHYHGRAGHRPAPYGLENAIQLFMANDLDGPFWDQRRPNASAIRIPFLSASSWHSWKGPGHVRGNLEMFKAAPSEHKRLRVSTGNYFVEYYSDEIFAEQLAWFDYWLKGIQRPEFDQPRVRLALQSAAGSPIWLKAQDWPLPNTRSQELYLARTGDGALRMSDVQSEGGYVTYEAPGELPLHAEPILGASDEEAGLSFQSESFREQVDIVGEVSLTLWAASSNDDMDLHVFLDLVTADGCFIELSRGWLKASHRELDAARTTKSRPWHRHHRVLPLSPDKPERLDIEIWPMAVRVSRGESLRLRIAGRGPGFLSGWHRRARGAHTIHFGGERPSRLILPMILKQ